jgi:diguanylate cyclase (GGDEF)-like protein
VKALDHLLALNARIRHEARTDELTGLRNRRGLMESVEQAWHDFRRYRTPAVLLLIDLNHFKLINDRHGHLMGDLCLRAVASHLASHVRSNDCIARCGGDEFIILLRNTGIEAARLVLAKLQANPPRVAIAGKPGESLAVNFSVGLSAVDEHHDGVAQWMSRADRRMYQQKTAIRLVTGERRGERSGDRQTAGDGKPKSGA